MQLHKLVFVLGSAIFGTLLTPVTGAAATQYRVTFTDPVVVAGVELAPGDYKLVLDGDKLTISGGKQTASVEVKVQTESEKFRSNAVRYLTGDGKYHVDQIRLGGTSTTLTFPAQGAESAQTPASSGKGKKSIK